MKKKLFITGGAGFIGSHIVLDALEKGYEVWNIDVLNYASNLSNLDSVKSHPSYHFIKGDICNKDLLDEVFHKESFDFVIHLAAETHVDRSITGPEVFVKTNVLGTQNLLECVRKYKTEKFVHVSTDEVYGDLSLTEKAFTESSFIKPNSPYSASKAASDLLVRSYIKTYGIDACITRCSNNYGPHQDMSKLIPVIISKAQKNEKIPIYGDGQNIRDWLYVKDHVSAIFKILEKGVSGEVYNIGGDNEQKNIDLVKMVLAIMGKSEDLIEFVNDRPGHDYRYAIDSSKIQNELGWKSQQGFKKLLEETICYYNSEL
ncbi:dTDP-glucose 4,6-dehydratase [Candidatus Peregrinibacteria bacterium]|jgi:dTDP-glucose 4,6-dehydratase|nr:dTDP-glucose 4,6-dehydratase [Candidatus Peregrinibacteria bacterium]